MSIRLPDDSPEDIKRAAITVISLFILTIIFIMVMDKYKPYFATSHYKFETTIKLIYNDNRENKTVTVETVYNNYNNFFIITDDQAVPVFAYCAETQTCTFLSTPEKPSWGKNVIDFEILEVTKIE